MFHHPLVSRTPTAWPILKLLLMARTIPSTLPDLGSGAPPFFKNTQKIILTCQSHIYHSVPTILISPWVGSGVIEHEGTNNGRTYTHSSIAGFISKASLSFLLIIFLILMEYHDASSSGISTMESPWHHVWLSRLPSSISLRTISVITFQSTFPTLIRTKCGLMSVHLFDNYLGYYLPFGLFCCVFIKDKYMSKCNSYTSFLSQLLVCLNFAVVELDASETGYSKLPKTNVLIIISSIEK